MKTIKIILIFLIFSLRVFGQITNQEFKLSDYPADKYKVDSIVINQKDFKIILIKAKDRQHLDSYEGTKIWFQQIKDDKKIAEKYLGETGGEYGFYIPNPQPLDNYFVLVECGEYNGTINLINSEGQWTGMPGYYFAADNGKKIFVTKAAGDGELTVSKINLTTKKIEKKDWRNSDGQDPWNGNYKYYYVTDNDWIK